MKVKTKKILLVMCFSIVLFCTMNIYAHSGRTDSSGGHKDNKNASGLGSYHFHCHGNPPHLHTNGICPYAPVSVPVTTKVAPVIVKSINIESVTIASSVKDIEVGETLILSTNLLPTNATDKTIKWTSSNTSVIDVNTNGSIIAKSAGSAIVTASSVNGITDKKEIVVKQSPQSIKINKDTTELIVGQTIKLITTTEPTNSVYESTWISSDSKIVTVDATGNIKALKEGDVTIYIKTNNAKTDSINLKVTPDIITTDALQNENPSETSDSLSGGIVMLILGGAGYLGYKKYKNLKQPISKE